MLLRSITRGLRRGERGQEYLEFAIIVPILVLVIMGIVDFGRVLNTWLVVTHGAREGARVAAVGWDDNAVKARVDEVTAGLVVDVDILPPVVDGQRTEAGNPVTVTATTSVTLTSGWIAGIFGVNNVPVAAAGIARYEGPCIECP